MWVRRSFAEGENFCSRVISLRYYLRLVLPFWMECISHSEGEVWSG